MQVKGWIEGLLGLFSFNVFSGGASAAGTARSCIELPPSHKVTGWEQGCFGGKNMLRQIKKPRGATSQKGRSRRQGFLLEGLEGRQLLTLLGVQLNYPQVFFDLSSSTHYTAATQEFDVNAIPVYTASSPSNLTPFPDFNGTLAIQIKVDSGGNLVGGVPGNDLAMKDSGGNLLLSGEIVGFGSAAGTSSNVYDMRLVPTGGSLASNFSGQDIGIAMSSVPGSGGNFTHDFSGNAQGFLGPITRLSPSIDLVKLTNGTDNNVPTGPIVPVGSTVTWSYIVTNTGNVPLVNATVVDDNGTPGITADDFTVGTIPSLAIGASTTLTATGPAQAGQYENYATVTATDSVYHSTVTDTDLDHYFAPQPGINLLKLTNGTDNDSPTGPFVPVGSAVTWTYNVTNTGNVPLTITSLTDDQGVVPVYQSGDTDSNGLLDLTETWVYTASGFAQAGQYANVGTVNGKDSFGDTVNSSNPDHYFGAAPAIQLIKLTNGTDNDNPTGPLVPVGSTVTWTYNVTNTGNVTLKDVIVTDDHGTPGDTSDDFTVGTIASLAPGASDSLTATGIALAGQYGNVGTVIGTPVDNNNNPIPGAQNPTDSNPDHYFGYTTNIHIIKLTNGTDNDTAPGLHVAVGSTVTWIYDVSTTGNVPLSSVTVTDNIAGVNPAPVLSGGFNVGDANHDGLLETGETWAFTASGVAIAGQYTNVGTVTGTPSDSAGHPIPGAPTQTDSNPDNYYGDQPAIKIVKFVNGDDADNAPGVYVAAGSTVTFTYVVTNTGNVPLSNVAVTDDVLGPISSFTGDTNNDHLLETNETWTFTQTAIAQDGQVTNVGTVTGNDSFTNAPVTDNNPANYFGSAPGIKIVKLTNGTDNDTGTGPIVAVGSTVVWTYNVTNTGNIGLSNVVVTDDNGTPGNTADDFTVGTIAFLASGATQTLSHSGTAVAGQYGNVGTAIGTPVDDNNNPIPGTTNPTDSNPDHYFAALPGIKLVKLTNGTDNDSPTGPVVLAGSTVTWTYIVTNTGNVPLTITSLTDDQGVVPVYQSGDTNSNNLLDLTETWTYTASGIAQAGQYTNIGKVTGEDSIHETVASSNPDNYFGVVADIDIEKYVQPLPTGSSGGEGLTPGFWKQSQHFYAWSGPYAGGQNLNYDAIFGLTASQDDSSLTLLGALGRGGGGKNALGRHAVAAILNAANPNISYAFTISQIIAMVQNAYATNDFETAKNTLAAENEKEADLSTPASTPPSAGYGYDADTPPGITVTAGSQVQFTFVVTNPGQTPLKNVVVTDNNETPGDSTDDFHPTPSLDSDGIHNVGDDNADGNLDPGEVWIFTWTKTVTAGQHTNTGTVVGTPIDSNGNTGTPVTDSDDANWNAAAPTVTISGTKYLDHSGNGLTGDDTGLGGVTINLYKDVNKDGIYQSGTDTFITSTTTASNGTYAFSGLATGFYIVREVVPTGYIRTFPTFNDYYGVNASSTQVYGGYNFANAEKCDLTELTNITYTITHINGCKETVTDLRGHVDQGDIVTVTFTHPDTDLHTFSLVSYTAPGPTFDANTASQQQIFDLDSVTVGQGTFSLSVQIPDCYFQVDFVCGEAIDQLGPANSNIFYTPQNRLFSADNDGTNACCVNTSSLSGFVYWDADNDGIFDTNESPISGVTVTLTGKDNQGHSVLLTTTTGSNGSYLFNGLKPSDSNGYTLTETQPAGYLDGKDTIGTPGGTTGNDFFSKIVLNANVHGINNNFGEQKAPTNGSLSGYVYEDCDNDGVQDNGEVGIANVTVSLYASNGTTLLATTKTDSTGKYSFNNLPAGTYVIKESTPSGYLDGKETPGSLGGTIGQDMFSSIAITAGASGTGYNFGEVDASSLSGNVYADSNNDGIRQSGESGIGNVTLKLYDANGVLVATTTTNSYGQYTFNNLYPGTYKIIETQPAGYVDGIESAGSLGGDDSGDNNLISAIPVSCGQAGCNYNFGELSRACVDSGDTATIGFWHNKNGQNLIKCLNGGSTSTSLAKWLSTTFPKIYGVKGTTTYLCGKTNADVAALFLTLFNVSGQKLDAQVLAVALAVYTTTSSLGGTAGIKYGFDVNSAGTGADTYNVGTNGAAFGVSNYSTITVIQALTAANNQAVGGVLYNGNWTLRTDANNVFSAINQLGDIN